MPVQISHALSAMAIKIVIFTSEVIETLHQQLSVINIFFANCVFLIGLIA